MRNNKLKEIRKKCALTQQQVADALGVERSTYTYYETGKTDPSISTLQKIMVLFDCEFDEIYPYLTNVAEPFSKYNEGTTMNFSQLYSDEKELIANYRLLKPDDRQKIYQEALNLVNGGVSE